MAVLITPEFYEVRLADPASIVQSAKPGERERWRGPREPQKTRGSGRFASMALALLL
jgi:hypothetical protein